MIPARLKYPTEARTVTFDFGPKMPGETIAGTPVIVVPGGITSSLPLTSGAVVSTRLAGGTAGQNYPVTCEVTTSASQILKLAISLEVRDDAN